MVVAAQHQVVEPVVIGAGQLPGAARVLPRPLGEPLGQLGRLLLGGDGRVQVQDPPLAVGGLDQVADLDLALLQDRLGQRGRRVTAGSPGRRGQHRVAVAAHRPHLPARMLDLQAAVIERLAQELLDVVVGDPGRAQPGVDLSGCQVTGDDLAQLGHVDGEPGVVLTGLLRRAQLVPDVSRQVLRRRDQPPGLRVVEDQRAELGAGLVFAGAEQPGDLGKADLAAGVQADRQRVSGGVRAQAGRPGRDHPLPEDRGLGGPLPDRVELLQGLHQRRERIIAEPAPRPAGCAPSPARR